MPRQGIHPSEPSAPTAEAPKRKRQRWAREEEQRLANILSAHPEWTDDLFPNRRNGEPRHYFKSRLAKQIAAQVRTNDPPTATAVLYKINSMERRFSDWRHRKSQAGSKDGAPLASPDIHAEDEPWFEQFEKLLNNKQNPQSPRHREQGEVASNSTPSCSDPRRQQSQDASELGLTAPLAKKRKSSDSVSSSSDSISSSSSLQDEHSDTSFEALMEASDRRIKALELQCKQARQRQIALIPRLFREMDDIYDDVEEHLLDSMKVMLLQNLLQSI